MLGARHLPGTPERDRLGPRVASTTSSATTDCRSSSSPILIKVVLLPLGVKQIKSMQAMQSIQPKVKELQKKYKGNKAKVQEETMKLYKEAGVNPLGGCLPLLLQFPILIAMYAVIRAPQLQPDRGRPTATPTAAYSIHNSHLPVDSQLFENVLLHEDLEFLGMNLQCSAAQSGSEARHHGVRRRAGPARQRPSSTPTGRRCRSTPRPAPATIPCGYDDHGQDPVLRAARRHDRHHVLPAAPDAEGEPSGRGQRQQQAILKLMPIMFGIFGYTFPAGLTLYWTVSNIWQIGQQYVLLKAGHIGPDAMERRIAEQRAEEREQARQARAHGADAGARGAGRRRPRAASRPRSRVRGRSRPEAPGPARVARARRPRAGAPTRVDGRDPKSGGAPKTGRRPQHGSAEAWWRRAVARETEKRAPSVEEAVEAALHELGRLRAGGPDRGAPGAPAGCPGHRLARGRRPGPRRRARRSTPRTSRSRRTRPRTSWRSSWGTWASTPMAEPNLHRRPHVRRHRRRR